MKIVRSHLIYEIVQPVGEDEVCVGAPAVRSGTGRIIIGEVVDGECDVKSLIHVAPILVCEGVGIVFKVSRNEEAAVAAGSYNARTCLGRYREKLKFTVV